MQFYRQLNTIQAMTFDLDDTLYDNRPVIRRLERDIAAWLHSEHSVTATRSYSWWQQLKIELATQHPELKHDVTKWRFEQICQGLIQLGYTEQKANDVAEQAIERVLRMRSDFSVPEQTHLVMAKLAKQLPLVGITNGNVDPDKIGLSEYFQVVLKAGPDGRAKPEADLFLKAQQHLNIAPQHILHVGDHLRTDVLGAKNHGFMACWFNDQGLMLHSAPKARVLPDVEIAQLDELLALV